MLNINQYLRINYKNLSLSKSAEVISWISQLCVLFTFGLSLLQVCSLKTVDMNVDNRERLKVLTGLWEMQASLLVYGKEKQTNKQKTTTTKKTR